jgi:hypothetical protein
VFVLGGIFLIGAWFALAYRPGAGTPDRAREESPAGQR